MYGAEVNPLSSEKEIGKFSEVQEQWEINMKVLLKKVTFMFMVYTLLYDDVHTYVCVYVFVYVHVGFQMNHTFDYVWIVR